MGKIPIHYWNSTAKIVGLTDPLFSALRYDLAYEDPNALPQNGWDGWWRLLDASGQIPSGLVPELVRLLDKYGVPHQVFDHREKPEDPIPLHEIQHQRSPRDYQERMALNAIRLGRGVIDAPPRSGKTYTGALIYDRMPHKTLWIAPTRGIVTQTVRSLGELLPGVRVAQLMGGGSPTKRQAARRAAAGADIVVTTAATAKKLSRAFYGTRDMMIVDEFHHAGAVPSAKTGVSTYQEINRLAEGIYYRFGMTGTHFRSDANTEILMHALLSEVVGRISVQELVDQGHLTPAHVLFLPIQQPVVRAGTYDEAYRFGIVHHRERNQMVAHAAQWLAHLGRQVVVLVKWVDHGEKLAELLPGAVFLHGQLKGTAVDDGIAAFNRGQIPILIGTSVLGEGIDLPRADALVYAKGGKASVTVTQDFYRVLTAVDGKHRGIIVDFADRHCTRMRKHSEERGKIYTKEDSFEVSIMDPDEIPHFPRRISELLGVVVSA